MPDEKINTVGPIGREGPPGREGAIGRAGPVGEIGSEGHKGSIGETGTTGNCGARGIEGIQGPPGINSINSITRFQYVMMMVVFWVACTAFIVMLAAPIFVFGYPFKTIDIVEPIKILNPGNRVPLGGVIELQTHFIKYINEPGLIVATIIRKDGDEVCPIDSFTWLSNRSAGSGTIIRRLPVSESNHLLVGKDCYVIFTIRYELWGIRPIVKQFESEPFEIYHP